MFGVNLKSVLSKHVYSVSTSAILAYQDFWKSARKRPYAGPSPADLNRPRFQLFFCLITGETRSKNSPYPEDICEFVAQTFLIICTLNLARRRRFRQNFYKNFKILDKVLRFLPKIWLRRCCGAPLTSGNGRNFLHVPRPRMKPAQP